MNCIEEMLHNNEQLFRGKKVKNVRADVHLLEFEFEEGGGAIILSNVWKDAPLGHGLIIFPHNVKGHAPLAEGERGQQERGRRS